MNYISWLLRNIYHFPDPRLIINLLLRKPIYRIKTGHFKISAHPNGNLFDIVNDVFIHHKYDPPFLTPPSGTVVDVGANVGAFSLYASKFKTSQIYAIEPFPENLSTLKNNVKLNHVSRIKICKFGLSNKTGLQKLYVSDSTSGHLLFPKNIHGKLNSYIKIPCLSFSRFIQKYKISRIDFLKLDCEGAEGLVLPSIHSKHWSIIKQIALEYHDNVSPLNHHQLIDLLYRNHFQVLHSKTTPPFGYIYARNISLA